jgi:mannose-6-phosphate isomerase
MKPVLLAPNRPRQFYRGGDALGAFRASPPEDDHRPEDWVGSTTARAGSSAGEGLTTLPDGRLLRDAVNADPEGWLGPEHACALGANPGLLVKLLDAGERLPVHVHPTRGFARRHLGCGYGKTEAWVILAAHGGASQVHLGFSRDVEAGELERWMAAQDAGAMLGCMHAVSVRAGDAVFVPAGLPHAIGAGIVCLELQEPTDFSMMLEWEGFELDRSQLRLGLDAEVALDCVQRKALGEERLAWLRSRGSRALAPSEQIETLFAPDADEYFRAERLRTSGSSIDLDAGFSIIVVLDGDGRIEPRRGGGGALALRAGDAALVPHGAGETTLSGALVAVRCRPPSVEAALAAGLGRS